MTNAEYLTLDEIETALSDIGETGTYKVVGEDLLIQREQNADWRYCGAVKDASDVDEFFAHDEAYEMSSW